MTKFKKCDYCKEARKDVKKYKSGIIDKFGENLHSRTFKGTAKEKFAKVVFYLCDMCIEFLVPEEHRRNNVISDSFLNVESEIWSIQKRGTSLGAHSGIIKK